MVKIIRIGMDTSKSVFQLHGVDENEVVVLRRKLRRNQVIPFFAKLEPTMIGLEACAGSHWLARKLKSLGHEAVLIPPQYVKAYLARGKNDKNDSDAICEAMDRPRIKKRFVPIKTVEQQAGQMIVGVRESLIQRRTQVSNTIRGYAAEYGIVVRKGLAEIEPLLEQVLQDDEVPEPAKQMFAMLLGQYRHANAQIREIDARMMAFHRSNELSRRLAEVPTIGPVTAMALAAKVTDPKAFRSGRDFAAWIGLTPKDHSTAGKMRQGVITRAGDKTLRTLLVTGATAVVKQAENPKARTSPWLADLLKRKPRKLVAVALANKTARIAWKLMVSGERYNPRKAAQSAEKTDALKEAA